MFPIESSGLYLSNHLLQMQEHVGGQGAEERGRRSSETTNLENFDDQLKNSSFNVKGVIMLKLFERLQKFKN